MPVPPPVSTMDANPRAFWASTMVVTRRAAAASTSWPASENFSTTTSLIGHLLQSGQSFVVDIVRIEPTQFLGEAIACLLTTQRNQRVRTTGAEKSSGRALLRTTNGDAVSLEHKLHRQHPRKPSD